MIVHVSWPRFVGPIMACASGLHQSKEFNWPVPATLVGTCRLELLGIGLQLCLPIHEAGGLAQQAADVDKASS
jgi:hypothetical protein